MTQADNKKLNRAFDAFMKLSRKRLFQKEQKEKLVGRDKDTEISTPILTGNAYDELRKIVVYPKTISEESFFDVSNLLMMAWYKQIHSKRKKK